MIECSISKKVKNFIKNGFIIGVIIHLVLPIFLRDLNIGDKYLGINTVLFVINLILVIMKDSGISQFFIQNILVENKLSLKS